MPTNYEDIKKDWNEAYKQAYGYWSPYLSEAKLDLKFSVGDQWTAAEKNYLESQRREALVFNKTRRVVKLLTGYQRRNRYALKADPVEGSDTQTANQLSGIILHTMQEAQIYHCMSDAFENGAIKTGANLVELYMDYSDDPVNGCIRAKRMPYNRFLVDPNFAERDFSDAGYMLTRDYLRKSAVQAILPKSRKKTINQMRPSPMDAKFSDVLPYFDRVRDDLYRYDRFYTRDFKEKTLLLDSQTGQSREWNGTKELLQKILMEAPQFQAVQLTRPEFTLNILVEGEVMYSGKDPSGLIDLPFVPVIGFWEPELNESQWKLQGVVRALRDPQTEINKRRSKMLDIIDSQITTGWKAKQDSVVNPEALYQSGQGQVIWGKKSGELADFEQLRSVDVPEGVFRAIEIMDRDSLDVSAVNLEMFGQSEGDGADVSGILSKLRTGSGLTALQDLFDNYRLSKHILGNKMIKMIQANYKPEKVQRMLNEQPSKEFYARNFGKYDAIPTEGVLSDSQKQMAFQELRALRAEGMEIPGSAVIDASNIQNKDVLMKHMQQAEQAQAQAAQVQQQTTAKQLELINMEIARLKSEITENQANIIDKIGERKASDSQAILDKVKAVKELEGMDIDNVLSIMERLKALQEPDTPVQSAPAAPTAPAQAGGVNATLNR